jgi:hypothetical protein
MEKRIMVDFLLILGFSFDKSKEDKMEMENSNHTEGFCMEV